MISALVFLIPKSDNEAEYVVPIDANKVVIDGVLLEDDASRFLRSCICYAEVLIVCFYIYNAYDWEALVVVETVSRGLMTYLISC
jgi:hypothetical protein